MKTALLRMITAGLVCMFLLVAPAALLAADKININTATPEQLTELPGIGPATAAKIVEHRTAHPFTSAEQIMDVKGIGQAKYDAVKELIVVEELDPKAEKNAAPKKE
jgi:competence protein ComEA